MSGFDHPIHGIETDTTVQVDDVVLGALEQILKTELVKYSYLSSSCYLSYQPHNSCSHCRDTILGWKNLEGLCKLSFTHFKNNFSRARLIEKVRPIMKYDEDLMNLLSDACNMPVLYGHADVKLTYKNRIPSIPYLSDILFDLYLDYVDRKIEKELPDLQYARCHDEILYPIYRDKMDLDEGIKKELIRISKECELWRPPVVEPGDHKCSLESPLFTTTVRGGEDPIHVRMGSIFIQNEISMFINNDGNCEIRKTLR